MIFESDINLMKKLQILSDAAKYDVACTSSGVQRDGIKGEIGNAMSCGICHSFAADGRCVSLLKILFTNECIYNCKYCINRVSNDVPRTSFTPEEVCRLTMEFYRRNYIEGLFLSSGILYSPDYTMELICKTLHDLRVVHRFNGYIHCKAIPGASQELVELAGWYADRMSVNLELPTEAGLRELAPNKSRKNILTPMRQIQSGMAQSREMLGMKGGNRSAYWYTSKRMGRSMEIEEHKITPEGSLTGGRKDRFEKQKNIYGRKNVFEERNNIYGRKNVFEKQKNIDGRKNVFEERNNIHKSSNEKTDNISMDTGKSAILNADFKGRKPAEQIEKTDILSIHEHKAGSNALTMWNKTDTSRGFVPAGQSTQMIIGATGESDYEIMSVSEALYKRFDLKRVFYSAFINVNNDSTLPAQAGEPPLRREHRLYQADWLLRYYGFEANELLSEKRPFFNTFLDPKCDWALGHLEDFPVEINKADYNTLLRVPGIGVKSAGRIVRARKSGSLDFNSLKAIGVVLKRAVFFITCNGRMMYDFLKVDEDYITRSLVTNEGDVMRGFGADITYKQLTLFDDFQLG